MKNALYKRKRYQILFFSILPVFFAVINFAIFLYQNSISSKEVFNISLSEIAAQQKINTNSLLDTKLQNIRSFGSFFFSTDLTENKRAFLASLNSFKKNNNFETFFFADKYGTSISSEGKTYYIKNLDFFRKGIKGFSSISQCTRPETNEPKLILYAPVFDAEKNIAGIVGGVLSQESFNSLLQPAFSNSSYSYIITETGEILAHTQDINITNEEISLSCPCPTDEIKICTYQFNEKKYYALGIDLGLNGWKLVTIADNSVFLSYTTKIALGAFFISALNLMTFICMLIIIVVLQEKHTKELARLAFNDPVTGGFSLPKFYKEAKDFKLAHKNEKLFAICFDIDNFRVINDLYGFDEGDNVLSIVHTQVRNQLNNTGIICRVSNDTYYMLNITNGSQEAAMTQIKTFEQTVNTILEKSWKHYRISFVFGFYLIEPSIPDIHLAFERANQAHNRAKKSNMASAFYQEKFRISAIHHKEIENSMRNAFDNLEFKMFLQPKYELLNKTLVGAEALIRWESPLTGNQFPDDFIPVFEKTGFIVQVDLYMMEKTCQILRECMDKGFPPVTISVNQSKLLLLNPLYFNVITSTIEKYNIPPNLIEIEVTETIMYENTEVLNKLISQLHTYGLRIAIDDFGSGYSSLLLLRDIKADVLKIDKEFIYKAEHDISGRKILSAIIQLADSLDMSILAEGIETQEQADMLCRLGCHIVQGYLFGKPVSAESFLEEKLIQRNAV